MLSLASLTTCGEALLRRNGLPRKAVSERSASMSFCQILTSPIWPVWFLWFAVHKGWGVSRGRVGK
jgi:hypothetical protein